VSDLDGTWTDESEWAVDDPSTMEEGDGGAVPQPVLAVVGRPNVGKSTLVNRILGRREAVVQDVPGVTRDRVAYDALWNGRKFTVVDTGGWEPDAKGLQGAVAAQAQLAMNTADAVLLVVDASVGATSTDEAVARVLRRSQRPVLVAANKADDQRSQADVASLWSLGLGCFLRSSGSLIQTIGRCARNINGRAVLYADTMTESMQKAIDETNRRRALQEAYNAANGITPQSIVRPLEMSLASIVEADYPDLAPRQADEIPDFKSQDELDAFISKLENEMREMAKRFEFEKAAKLRDKIKELRTKEFLFA
jgi:small GTP-binding protein